MSLTSRLLIFCQIASLVMLLQGATWDGSTDNDYTDSTNWDSNNVPDSTSEDANFDNTGSNRNVDMGGTSQQIRDLTWSQTDGTAYTLGNGELDLWSGSDLNFDGSSNVTLNSDLTLDHRGQTILYQGTGSGTFTIAGTISGGGELHKYESNTIIFTGNATSHSNIKLFAGTATKTGNSWTASSEVWVGDTGTATLNVDTSATVTASNRLLVGRDNGSNGTLNVDSATVVGTNDISVGHLSGSTGTLAATNTATITTDDLFVGDAGTATGTVTIFSGSDANISQLYLGESTGTNSITVSGSGSTLTATGTSQHKIGEPGTGTLTVSDSGNVSIANAKTQVGYSGSATGNITVQSGGDLTLHSVDVAYNTSSSSTILVTGSGSTMTINNNSTWGRAGAATLDVDDSAVLTLNGELDVNSANLGSADIDINGGTINGTGSIKLANRGTLKSSGSGDGTVSVSINNNGDISTTGTGSLTLSGNNSSYTGDVLVDDTSTLTLNHASALTTSINSLTLDGGTLNADTDVTLAENITLTANSKVDAQSSDTLTLSGVISDGGSAYSLEKTSGSGTVTLSGSNTYTGNTVVSGGTLLLGAANRISDSSTLQLSGGTFNTGGFNETLGGLTLSAASTIDLGSSSSQLIWGVTNIDTALGSHNLTIYNWTGTANTSDGTDQLDFGASSTFTKTNQVLFYSDGGSTFAGYGALVNNELVADGSAMAPAIPEPSTYIGLLGLCSLCGWHIRQRRLRKRAADSVSA